MSPFSLSPLLEKLIDDNGWAATPETFVTREGRQAKIIDGCCYLPIESQGSRVRLNRPASPLLLWVATKYIVLRAQTISSIDASNCWGSIFGELTRAFVEITQEVFDPAVFQDLLVARMQKLIIDMRRLQRLHRCYRLIQFYIWAAQNYPELGFCPVYAWELDAMIIPGNPKGAAVRSDDPEVGALHHLLEVPLITAALERDTGREFEHFQQRAAVALAQCYGRNSANYIALHETDLVDLLEGTGDTWYILRIPRIKKGFRSARSDFIEESIDDSTRRFVQELMLKISASPVQLKLMGRTWSQIDPYSDQHFLIILKYS